MSTCEDRSMYIFCDSVLQIGYYLLKNKIFNGFYVKINLPQYVLTVTNVLGYKINIVAKKLDILCFTSILCIFFNSRCLTSKGHFFRNKLIAKVCFENPRPKFHFFLALLERLDTNEEILD